MYRSGGAEESRSLTFVRDDRPEGRDDEPEESEGLARRISTSGRPTSQKDWLLERFFLRSSVRRSAFIWAVRKVMPVFSLVRSSMSLAASGSNWKAAKTRISGLGWRVRASSQAIST